MKPSLSWMYLLACLFVVGLTACEETCNPNLDEKVGDEFFTVTFLDSAGLNLIDTWNPADIVVYLDTMGGRPVEFRPGYTPDGVFGPFNYTQYDVVDPELQEVFYPGLYFDRRVYTYYFRKDMDGEDTLRVEFVLEADDCNRFWREIQYFYNGSELEQYRNQQQANIIIQE
ncbi:hypothetical protein [Pontibacter sp. G13]|uniref:hypothetical protein n=1 Tax=Pontibacter sp. G13 TaxID=3074898 RepID=UPI00288BE135|nr:hypothetical protein [Pontibacter sp. G13]WNJ16004.1 hypothetical protein RJD25_14170 [Pontibacter sp. G13]